MADQPPLSPDFLNLVARQGRIPLASPGAPGYTPQQYDEALSQVVPPLMNAGMMAGTAGLGGPEAMTVKNLIQGLLAGMPAHDIPGVSMGMIPTMENLPEFGEKYATNLRNLKSGVTPYRGDIAPAALAEAYMATRYPGRYGKIPELKYGGRGLPSDVRGMYDRPGLFSTERVTLGPASLRDPRVAAGTLGHESQHVLQQARTPKMFKDYPREPILKSGQLNPAYVQHPTEVAARQAAQTAQSGFDKFLQLLGPQGLREWASTLMR
jgi:hypothetical protein